VATPFLRRGASFDTISDPDAELASRLITVGTLVDGESNIAMLSGYSPR
jgi:hypothetical protein